MTDVYDATLVFERAQNVLVLVALLVERDRDRVQILNQDLLSQDKKCLLNHINHFERTSVGQKKAFAEVRVDI